ncbi:MAG: IS1182 family transposase [Pseudomonadota bacterium]
MLAPVRNQVELHPLHLDALLAADHPARTVWAFVNALDLQPLYAQIRSVAGRAGAPAIDPAILVALWLWATVDGVGSAREVARLCERDDAYRWICGGVGVNYHTLSDFRTRHEAWLDAQLTGSIASLLDRGLVTMEVVAQDGLRVRAWAKASSFRRKDKLQYLHALAQAQVRALRSELEHDAAASTRRKQAARERSAREREQRLGQALATMAKLPEPRQPKPSKRRGKNESEGSGRGDDGPPSGGGGGGGRIIPKPVQTQQPRVSTTDPEVRVTKMADGGWRPAFNVQVAVDVQTQLIAGIDVVSGTDMKHMPPMHRQVHKRYGVTPSHWLADGGFGKLEAIRELYERGTQPVVPPYQTRNPAIDPLAWKKDDTAETAHWRKFMSTEWARELYIQRGASIECVNAHLRRRGLTRFYVRGLLQARAVALWHALAHNLMRLRSLGIAPA